METYAQSNSDQNTDLPDSWHVNTCFQDQQGTYDNNEYCFNIRAHIINNDDGSGGVNPSDVIQELLQSISDFTLANINLQHNGGPWNSGNINIINSTSLHENPDLILGNSASQENVIDIYFSNFTHPDPEEQPSSHSSENTTEIIVFGTQLNRAIISHELGHQFGLMHTYHGTINPPDPEHFPDEKEVDDTAGNNDGNGCNAGDYVDDTPADPGNLVSITGQFSCNPNDDSNSDYSPLTNNFMTNSHENCRDSFTNGQVTRMKHFIETGILPHLLLAQVDCPLPPPDPCHNCNENSDGSTAQAVSNTFSMASDCLSATISLPNGIWNNHCSSSFLIEWENGSGILDPLDGDQTNNTLLMDFSSGDNSWYTITPLRDGLEEPCSFEFETGCSEAECDYCPMNATFGVNLIEKCKWEFWVNSNTNCPDEDYMYFWYVDNQLVSNQQTFIYTFNDGVYAVYCRIEYENECWAEFKKSFTCGNGKIRLMPNPTKPNSQLLFEGVNSKNVNSIEIFDLFGNSKMKIKPDSNLFTIPQLQSGLYILKFYTNSGVKKKKLIIN